MPSYILKTLDEVVVVFLNIIETNVIITILPYTHIYAVPPATTSLFNAKILTETPKLLLSNQFLNKTQFLPKLNCQRENNLYVNNIFLCKGDDFNGSKGKITVRNLNSNEEHGR